eukprot:3551525-Amphidinium_carterae.4
MNSPPILKQVGARAFHNTTSHSSSSCVLHPVSFHDHLIARKTNPEDWCRNMQSTPQSST